MKYILEQMLKAFLEYPEEVHVSEVIGENSMIIEIRVQKTDIGKLIGKNGETIDAIRRILINIARKQNKRITIEVIE